MPPPRPLEQFFRQAWRWTLVDLARQLVAVLKPALFQLDNVVFCIYICTMYSALGVCWFFSMMHTRICRRIWRRSHPDSQGDWTRCAIRIDAEQMSIGFEAIGLAAPENYRTQGSWSADQPIHCTFSIFLQLREIELDRERAEPKDSLET